MPPLRIEFLIQVITQLTGIYSMQALGLLGKYIHQAVGQVAQQRRQRRKRRGCQSPGRWGRFLARSKVTFGTLSHDSWITSHKTNVVAELRLDRRGMIKLNKKVEVAAFVIELTPCR